MAVAQDVRDARRERARADLKDLLNDVGLAEWMKLRRRVHAYSLTNQVLIIAQCLERGLPLPHTVKASWKWKLDGYRPKQGSEALYIWVRKSRRRKDGTWTHCGNVLRADRCEKCGTQAAYFQIGPTFANHQVVAFDGGHEPPGPPEMRAPIDGDEPGRALIGPLAEWLWTEHGITTVESSTEPGLAGGARGYWQASTAKIVVDARLPRNERLAVLVHEAAHALGLSSKAAEDLTYEQAETLAEATAFVVCDAIGVDTGSAPYLAQWDADAPDTLERFARRIDDVARPIEKILTTAMNAQEATT